MRFELKTRQQQRGRLFERGTWVRTRMETTPYPVFAHLLLAVTADVTCVQLTHDRPMLRPNGRSQALRSCLG
jgi:hypothetical protein